MQSRNRFVALAALLIVAAVVLAAFEMGVRMFISKNPATGIQLIGRVALLPYVPDAEAAIESLKAGAKSTYLQRDETLGWSIKPNGEAGNYSATTHGFRGAKNWATTSAVRPGQLRVSVYGDSFTHGDGVPLAETWAAQLQLLRPDLEVLNFGVPAYGMDQAFLRYRKDGRKFDAHFHILGIWPEDLARNLGVFRFYLAPNGYLGTSKPRFELSGGALVPVNSPIMPDQAFLDTVLRKNISPLVKKDYWYREQEQRFPFYYHLQSVRASLSVYQAHKRRAERLRLYFDKEGEALNLAIAIAEAFRREVEASGSRPYISIIPMRELLDQHGAESFPLAEMLRERSIPVLDFGPIFATQAREMGIEALFLADGHLSARGNRLIAQEMYRRLADEFDRVSK